MMKTETRKNGLETKSAPKMKELDGKELANLLDVAAPSLCGAAKEGHQCKGYPVAKWARRDINGKLECYEVPLDVYETLSKETDATERDSDSEVPEKRNNPEKTEPNSFKPRIDNPEISLLPAQQNYMEPVIAFSVGRVGEAVITNDTANARAVALTASAAVGSFMGYKFSDNWIGALAGAFLGFGFFYLGTVLNGSEARKVQSSEPEKQGDDLGEIKPQTEINLTDILNSDQGKFQIPVN